MTDTTTIKPTDAALRAAESIRLDIIRYGIPDTDVKETARIIDRETALPELVAALENLKVAYERRIRSECSPRDLEMKPWRCAEFIAAEAALARAKGGQS